MSSSLYELINKLDVSSSDKYRLKRAVILRDAIENVIRIQGYTGINQTDEQSTEIRIDSADISRQDRIKLLRVMEFERRFEECLHMLWHWI